MLTIIIHYSKDRLPQLKNTISCLEEVHGTEDAQKILLVDGQTNIHPPGWQVEELPRSDENFYNCSETWNKGVELANNDKIWVLESDRIVPINWLLSALSKMDIEFLFPSLLYSLNASYPLEILKEIRDNPSAHENKLTPDHRVTHPDNGVSRKNPMSGCVLFTKKTFELMGGFDEDYMQAGYHDLDAFRSAHNKGIGFRSIAGRELHQKHGYVGGTRLFRLVNLWNAVHYHDKWNIELHPNIINLAKSLNIDIKRTQKNIHQFVKEGLLQI
tara:strand:- start:119 stop:934 length:816 start_codon:yes stop_codon:yes gene_type:complete